MKNYSSFCLFFLLSHFVFGQKTAFNIKYSEPFAVFIFLSNISPSSPENVFKEAFNKSKYNDAAHQGWLAQFDTLDIHNTYEFSKYPYGSKLPAMSDAILQQNLMACTNLTDFKIRSTGIAPMGTLNQLATLIATFTPIYKELIYEPNKAVFEKQLKEVTNYVAEKNISEHFETGVKFYNSSWDSSIPFEIALYPLPRKNGYNAGAFYNYAFGAIPSYMKDYDDFMSVLLHEIYHILYSEQPLAVKIAIDKYFTINPSKSRVYAHGLLDEALATAMGNGYAYEKLTGKIDTSEWYDSKYRNLIAKAIYPMVKDYVIQKKPIDQVFINNYIKIYEEKFPTWIDEMENLMVYRCIITDNDADIQTVMKVFPQLTSMETGNVIISDIEKHKVLPLTKLFIVSKNNQSKLELIKKTFPELKKWNFQPKKEFLYNVFLKDKTHLFIINQLTSTTETLLKKLSTTKK
jgi:hypothetical protein